MEQVGSRIRMRSAKRFFGSAPGEHALESNMKIDFICQENFCCLLSEN